MVDHGADVNRFAFGDPLNTASMAAERAGKPAIAEWLTHRMDPALLERQQQLLTGPFAAVYRAGTSGDGLGTEDIVAILRRWDEAFGITVKHASVDQVTVHFASLPERGDGLYREILELCFELEVTPDELSQELQAKPELLLWFD